METEKKLLCVKGDGIWIKKGLVYEAVHYDNPYMYKLKINYKNLVFYLYYHKSRFKELNDV